jgi:hypothetical protein
MPREKDTPLASAWLESRRPLPAWVLSLSLHMLLFLLMAWTIQQAPRGATLEPDRQVGIALVHQGGDERTYESPGVAESQAASETAAEALPTVDDLNVQLPGAESVEGLVAGAAELEGAGSGTGAEVGPVGGGGPAGTTRLEVFGITGEGSKFVFVFDRSGSMDGYGGRPLAAAKRELIASLRSLDAIHQFQIIFYNEQPSIFRLAGQQPQLIWGDAQGKRLAEQFIRGIVAAGGTRHLDALQLGLGMRPDVLFFLTDADEPRLTDYELRQVRRWNKGTVIHAIEFGFGRQAHADNFLVRLARDNDGQHTYVDISHLP